MTESQSRSIYVLRTDLEQRLYKAKDEYATASDEKARCKAKKNIEFWQELLDGAPALPEGYVPKDQQPLQKELMFDASPWNSGTNIFGGMAYVNIR